ncbi:MAG: PHA/PHB synthase family protein [Bdellovibrionales bacterium]
MTKPAEKQDNSGAKLPDPVELAHRAMPLLQRAGQLMGDFLQKHADDFTFRARVGNQAAEAFGTLARQWMKDPVRLMQAQVQWWQDYLKLVQETGKRWAGASEGIQTAARDKRFHDAAWQQNAMFDLIKQSYLLTARWMQALVKETPDLDARTQQKIAFYTRQFVDAMSPTNFWLTNPEVLRTYAETGGENFIQGLQNMLKDMEGGQGQLRISMTDVNAFTLGENIASTPGRVVYRNDLIELIQYEPVTKDVHRTPLLIIPPWINKYYILDLKPENSFVRYALEQGHTVFMISWVNPDARLADKNFEDYMAEGPLAALDAIDKACGTTTTNVIGYCLGGTLLAATLAHLQAKNKAARIASATFFVTMIDFDEPGDLGVFIDEPQIMALEKLMFEKGYLPGAAMATTFNLLRANDLIWSFVINNYMLGRDPLPFDLLYWNADATNMPAAMHAFYLRRMYLENKLREPGGLTLLGTPIDLRKVETPSYFISTRDDHIAPWQSTYAATRLFKGPVEFVLGGSGHIAGIINPPAANKYAHWTGGLQPTPESWLDKAVETKGSWWPHWAKWQEQHAGEKVPARTPDKGLEAAPGTYVKVRA